MKKHIIELFTATVLLTSACVGYAAVNPVTVTYDSGSTSFVSGSSGTANYVVSVNSDVIPAGTPLIFHLTNTGASSGLTATQITGGSSPCTSVTTLCGSSFSLKADQSCCLAFTLTSTKAGNNSMQPSISTTPAAYQAKAASAQPIMVSMASALSFTSIYTETNSSINSLVTYSPDNGTTWGYMLSPQGGWAWDQSTWATAATVVNGTTTMYQATGVQGNGTCISSQCNGAATLVYSSDGITWNQVTNTLPTSDHQDWVQSLFAAGDTVYAGTGEGYVYYTNNQGSTWGPAAPSSVPDSSTVHATVVDANGVFYAGTQGGHIYYSTTSGQSWTPLTNQPGGTIQSLGIDTNGTLYVVTDNTTTQPQYNTAPLTGGSWQLMTALPSGNATAIAATGTTVYVGTDNTAVMYTSNYGAQWNGGQLPSGSTAPIASLFVNQGPLSPLFVESYGIIPLNGGASQCGLSGAACTVTVKNLSNTTVTNVHANSSQLPSGVTQQSSSGCASVAPTGSCFLTFSASGTNGFAPTVFSIIDNNRDAVSEAALVSSVTPNGGSNYYYVYAIDALNAYVADSTNTSNGIIWSSDGTSTDFTSIWGIAENSTTGNAYPNSSAPIGETATLYGAQQACNGATDGICNSNNIYIYYNGYSTGNPVPTSDYAEGICYANQDGGAAGTGEWHLPAACELNGSIYFDITNNQFGSCTPALTGIFSLYNLGNLGGNLSSLLAAGVYWSSTEVSNNPQNLAWFQFLATSGSGYQFLASKSIPYNVRCSLGLPL